MLINLESFTKKEHSSALEGIFIPPDLSLLWKSPWHLRLPSLRSILNSCIICQSPPLDSSVASHIHLKKMYWPKLSLHVLSAFKCTGLPLASLLSVKRVSLSFQLPRICLGSKFLSTLTGSQLLSTADYANVYYTNLSVQVNPSVQADPFHPS